MPGYSLDLPLDMYQLLQTAFNNLLKQVLLGSWRQTGWKLKKGDDCEMIYLAPNDQLIECELSPQTIKFLTVEATKKLVWASSPATVTSETKKANGECH